MLKWINVLVLYTVHVNNNVVCGQRCYKQRQREKERGWNIIIIYARNAIDLIQSRVDMVLQRQLIEVYHTGHLIFLGKY